MAIRLPRDASGHVIPLDTTMMYRDDNSQFHVTDFFYEAKPDRWFARNGSMCVETSRLYLDASEKDSWEKLEEDLDRALSTPDPDTYTSVVCGYFDSANVDCEVCESMHGINGETCNDDAWRDIAARIRKLRGEDDA